MFKKLLNSAFKNGTGCVVPAAMLVLYNVVTYIVNIVQLFNCDFDFSVSMKHEIIHAVGLIPGCNMITVWF